MKHSKGQENSNEKMRYLQEKSTFSHRLDKAKILVFDGIQQFRFQDLLTGIARYIEPVKEMSNLN